MQFHLFYALFHNNSIYLLVDKVTGLMVDIIARNAPDFSETHQAQIELAVSKHRYGGLLSALVETGRVREFYSTEDKLHHLSTYANDNHIYTLGIRSRGPDSAAFLQCAIEGCEFVELLQDDGTPFDLSVMQDIDYEHLGELLLSTRMASAKYFEGYPESEHCQDSIFSGIGLELGRDVEFSSFLELHLSPPEEVAEDACEVVDECDALLDEKSTLVEEVAPQAYEVRAFKPLRYVLMYGKIVNGQIYLLMDKQTGKVADLIERDAPDFATTHADTIDKAIDDQTFKHLLELARNTPLLCEALPSSIDADWHINTLAGWSSNEGVLQRLAVSLAVSVEDLQDNSPVCDREGYEYVVFKDADKEPINIVQIKEALRAFESTSDECVKFSEVKESPEFIYSKALYDRTRRAFACIVPVVDLDYATYLLPYGVILKACGKAQWARQTLRLLYPNLDI